MTVIRTGTGTVMMTSVKRMKTVTEPVEKINSMTKKMT